MLEEYNTIFFDGAGERIGDLGRLICLPLYKGMKIKIHGYKNPEFTISSWKFVHDHLDQDPGLHIFLEETASQ